MSKPGISLVSDGGLAHTARLLLDGHDVSSMVRKARLTVESGEHHVLELELIPYPLGVSLNKTDVRIPEDMADVLVRLGWTPPPAEDDQ